MAAMCAEIMWPFQFATIGAFVECFNLQRIMRAANTPAMGRYFSFGDSHFGTCSCKFVFVEAALVQSPKMHKLRISFHVHRPG
jgi:hypothetical protein